MRNHDDDMIELERDYRRKDIWLILVLAIITLVVVRTLVIPFFRGEATPDVIEGQEADNADVVLVMDVSTSMLAEDMIPNRMGAAKLAATDLIVGRRDDRIGLVVFAGEAFSRCELTQNHDSLLNLLETVNTDIAARGEIEDGTAIGMGLACALNQLKASTAKDKVVVLFTDGANNRGDMSPQTAAEIATILGVRVYTIGIGKNGTARYPLRMNGYVQYINIPVEIDSITLIQLAKATNGRYFCAEDGVELIEICRKLDFQNDSTKQVDSLSQSARMDEQVALRLLKASERTEKKTLKRIQEAHHNSNKK